MKDSTICAMEYGKDEFGKEILLKEGKFQVMMEWEKPYMEACIDFLQPRGDVLEIGFGCGYSATHIQSFTPKSHTIIEYHPVVAQKARAWAERYPHVHIIEDTWQNALSSLGIFDAIFFDDYPLESGEEMKKLEEEHRSSHAVLQQGNALLEEVEKKIPFLQKIVYSDADLEELISHFFREKDLSSDHLIRFVCELCSREQITHRQKEGVIARLQQRGIVPNLPSAPQDNEELKFPFRGPNERVLTFLQQALPHHMRKGSCFSCFLSSSVSKYEDPKFVDAVICNPHLEYKEYKIPIAVPANCHYYSEEEALVIKITKRV